MPSTDGKLAPFYFLVVFWGAKHREYFVDYCLSGLLAPGNIPALDRPARPVTACIDFASDVARDGFEDLLKQWTW